MRPTPQEIVTGAIRVLTQTVAPTVGDDYAANRLREVCAVLGQIDWDNAAAAVAADNRVAETLLSKWCDWVDADTSRATATQRATVADLLTDSAKGAVTFTDLNERNAELRRTVVDAAEAVTAWAGGDEARRMAARPLLTAMLANYSSTTRAAG